MIQKVSQMSCDVYGSIRGTERYHIIIMRVDEEGRLFDEEDPPVLEEMIDLGPRAYARLVKNIYKVIKRDPPATVPEPAAATPVVVKDDDGDVDTPPLPAMTPQQETLAGDVIIKHSDPDADPDRSPTGDDAQEGA